MTDLHSNGGGPPPHHGPPPVIDLPTTNASEIYQVSLWKQLRHLSRQIRQQGMKMTLLEALDQWRRITLGAPGERFTRITPELYCGGQHLRRGLPILKGRGITAIINMRREADDARKKRTLARYLHLPTIDNTPPTLEHLFEGVQFIQTELSQGGKVYIHCWEGVGRAPTMTAAYLVSTGLSTAEAWAMIRGVRPFIRPTPMQQAQLEQFAREWGEKAENLPDPDPFAAQG
jgi:hypothetical protein